MSTKEQIEIDLKTALLAGDKQKATVLRGLKAAILNVEVERHIRDTGLPEDDVIAVLTKQSKQRQESADMYVQGNSPDRAKNEIDEKVIIDAYLPEQLGDEELSEIIDDVIANLAASGPQAMGQVIGGVKQRVGGRADGARVAAAVKEKLTA